MRRSELAVCLAAIGCAACSSSPSTSSDGPALEARAAGEARPADLFLDAPRGDRRGVDDVRGDASAPAGCPATQLAAGDHPTKISFGGKERELDLHVPAAVKAGVAAPLVLDFHGFTSNMSQQRLVSGMLAQSDAAGFVVAWPNGFGLARSWNAGALCCGDAQAQKLDDVGLAKAIVQKIASVVCIDPRRVYATGISNGGMLSHRLGCEAAATFAAVAPVAGRIDLQPMSSCLPPHAVPVIAFHGDHDELVPYQDAVDSAAYWAKVNGCTDAGSVTFTKGKASCRTHSACATGSKVTLCTLDAGHVTYWNADSVSIATLGWDFFKQFALP